MADRLFATVREECRSVRTLTVKVRYNDRDENQRAESLAKPTDLETDILWADCGDCCARRGSGA